MKIGILTHWWGRDNYGQVLQMYGLYHYLLEQEHEIYILRFNPYATQKKEKFKIKRLLNLLYPRKIWNYSVNIVNKLLKGRIRETPSRSFTKFQYKYLTFSEREYYSIKDLEDDTLNYNAIIVGSDQVWNYFSGGEAGFPVIDTYSIRFGTCHLIRLSYAASMGFSGTEEIHLQRLVLNLRNFQGISVREESAKKVLESRGLTNVIWVPDPSLLLSYSDYSKLVYQDDSYKVLYFLYILNNKSILKSKTITAELKKQHKEFIFVSANRLYEKEINKYPTVEEWLSYMLHAKTIITNSFHGCVFSILFHKNFYYFPLLPNTQGYGDSRIDSLLNRLGIYGRVIMTKKQLASVIANPEKPIDWDSVDIRREKFVLAGKDFLAMHLGAAYTE